ncbi:probable protein-S-isoprenylcysteine O-methyltransferase isoform X1 [Typha latifolia]|uniref:probable protein-S-isoprenylcysteine O-methyltransferase isoform X1 n=1 Tax=Typha latifolia TaxID=4733 RepID=UPI003C2D1CC5
MAQMAEFLMNYTACRQLVQFLAAIIFFHASEYALAVAFHGRSLVSTTSLLVSKQYALAMSCALLEYIIEIRFFPGMKEYWWISNTGLAMICIGEILRKAAVVTAGRAFTHTIRIYYDNHHELITHGIYSLMRHPGYSGFFIWATGTQVMMCNPVSFVAFTVVTWHFFSRRIPYEEYFLRHFFGSRYILYARKVPSGLPFIR